MININWVTKIITIPFADLTPVSGNVYSYDLNNFRLELKDLEDSVEGMAFPKTHNHNTTVTVGGITLARVIEIINGYTVTFEDGQYAVNLLNANSNVADVTNVNQVSVRPFNSTGLIQITQGSGVLPSDITAIESAIWNRLIDGFKAEDIIKIMASVLAGKVSGAGSGTESFKSIDDTKVRVISNADTNGNRTNIVLDTD